ncbi:MAG: hypothetical protein WCI02_06505 [Planctomycetota bacterium]
MARLARAEVFDPSEVAVVHVMARTVRRCYLLGFDPISEKDFDHRKFWIECKLQQLAAHMGIDLLAFTLMSNHLHLILRSRPDVVASWNDDTVARRWLLLCPLRKIRITQDGISQSAAAEPNEAELNSIRCNPTRLARIRGRLSDISWWMRLLSQHIAQRANREEGGGLGKFWQSRFKAVRILDEATLLACAAYVDVNPIRAALAETLETSHHTSVQRRIQTLVQPNEPQPQDDTTPARDSFLAPVAIDEAMDPVGPHPSQLSTRCSDKGFLPMSSVQYLQLLDWAARQVHPGKRGITPHDHPPILDRLGLDAEMFCQQVRYFGRMFSAAAGQPRTLCSARSLRSHRQFYVRPLARKVFARSG